jgi:hypothetical protein
MPLNALKAVFSFWHASWYLVNVVVNLIELSEIPHSWGISIFKPTIIFVYLLKHAKNEKASI